MHISLLVIPLAIAAARSFDAVRNATSSAQNMPLLKLPYGTWQATSYDPKIDVSPV